MIIENIERDFKQKVFEKINIKSEGINRYRVFAPFVFNDGDNLSIIIKKEYGKWILSDEGHTYMHLTYDLDEKDLQRGTRQNIITNALSVFSVQDREGELIVPIENESYGDAFFRFVQAILRIVEGIYFSEKKFNKRY